MKVSHKVVLCASVVVALAFSAYSWLQYSNVKAALYENTVTSTQESSKALALQVNNWLKGKMDLIESISQSVDADFSPAMVQKPLSCPSTKKNFCCCSVV